MQTSSGHQPIGSERVTRGVRVRVQPRYMAEHSDPGTRQFVFAYHVRIENEGSAPVRLISRRWIITDANGESHEVSGEGVIGQQPVIVPGGAYEYASFCPLPTAWGTMEGSYRMELPNGGGTFDAAIGRFYLVSPHGAGRAQG